MRYEDYQAYWTRKALEITPVNRPETEKLVAHFYKEMGRPIPTMLWLESAWDKELRKYRIYEISDTKSRNVIDKTIHDFHRAVSRPRSFLQEHGFHNMSLIPMTAEMAPVTLLTSLIWRPILSGFNCSNFAWWAYFEWTYNERNNELRKVDNNYESRFKFTMLAIEIAKQVPWWRPHTNVCLLSERPSKISFSDRTGPSIIWGHKEWYLIDQVLVPKHFVMEPTKVDIKDCLSDNIEVRRIALDIFGRERFIKEAKGKIIDHDERYGTLWQVIMPASVWRFGMSITDMWLLEVVNRTPEPDGHYKHYYLKVPQPEHIAREFGRRRVERTAKAAVAWTFGMTSEEYDPEIES
jgi:hypothetical protein